jgi:glycerol uptake facilitator-like aquaporin
MMIEGIVLSVVGFLVAGLVLLWWHWPQLKERTEKKPLRKYSEEDDKALEDAIYSDYDQWGF